MTEMQPSAISAQLPTIDKRDLPYSLDAGPGHRARIGLIVLPDDQTIEYELRMIFDLPGVACFVNRLPCAARITPDTLKAMEREIAGAAGLIMPASSVDVVAYGCTSGSLFIGPDAVHQLIRQAHPNAICTTPIEAAIAALEVLNACSIALITPYENDINLQLKSYLEAHAYQVPVIGSWNEPVDDRVGRISPESIHEVARQLGGSPLVDTVFISCTNLRALSIISELESTLGKPVISSNQALGWHCLRLAEVLDSLPRYGMLLSR
jgi:maleate isomerase